MSLDAAPLWTDEQHAWLQALGHTVWVPGSVPVADAAPHAAPPRPAVRPASQRPAAAPPRPRPSAPALDEPAPAAAPRRPAAPARRAGTPLHDALHFALVRASGLNPNAPEAAQIMATWPASAQLRGNAAAKRALWPQLRALRKGAGRG